MKATLKQIKEMNAIYTEKGLNSVRGYIRRNSIDHECDVFEFGTETLNHATDKDNFIKGAKSNRTLRFHYYSVLRRAKNGYSFNIIRAIEFRF